MWRSGRISPDVIRHRARGHRDLFARDKLAGGLDDGNRPTAVPDGIVEDIRARQNEQGFVVVKTASEFIPGEKVTVAAGPMADHVGLVEKMTDEQRVVLLLDLLGRKVRVELALEDLAVNA